MEAASNPKPHRGWYDRGYLPHFDAPGYSQAITFRLADSLPQHVVANLKRELAHLPEVERGGEPIRRLNQLLDAGLGSCLLRDSKASALVQEVFLFGHGERYELLSWVVMPNHVHTLIRPYEGWRLETIVGTWKKRSAREINKALDRRGAFWSREYFDRFQRDAAHREKTIAYIEQNPVKAGLCSEPADWRWSSARFRDDAGQIDWPLIEATVGRPRSHSGEWRSFTSETDSA